MRVYTDLFLNGETAFLDRNNSYFFVVIILFAQCWLSNLNISLYIYYTYVHASYQSVVFLSCNIFSMVMLVLMEIVWSFSSPVPEEIL